VSAEELEARVLEEVLQKLKSPEVLLKIQELAQENEMNDVQLQSSLNNIGETWKYLYPQEQAKIMKLLINFVELRENGINIQMNMDGFNALLFGLGA
jgi:chromosome segregation and condensation protein ScpB